MTKMKTRMEKYNIAMEAIAGHTKQKHVAEKHGVTAATLSKWVKKVKAGELRGDERDASCKKARPLQFGEIEDRLVQYIKLRERKYLVDGLGLSWKLVQEKALKFAADMKATHPDKAATLDNFRASPGWFQGVRKRHNIKSVRLHGEAGSVDEETAATAMAEFKQAVAATSITNPQFVFNADETGLFYQTLPSRLYVSRSERSVRGVKQMAAKARLTIMTATSAAGEKVPLFSVGKSRRPMCLRDDFPPVRYTSQASAWFDTDMANYYVRFFLKWKRSRYGDEPVVLIWDNCPAHKNVTNPAPKELHLLFLPPNLTSKHQPMDMGLISAVKMRYKAYVLQQLLAYYDDGQQTPLPKSRGLRGLAHGAPPNIRDALTILKRVWDEVKPESVVRCWMKAACLPESFFPQQHTQQQQRVTSDEMLTERSSEEEGQEGEGGQLVQDGLGAENEQYDEAEQRRTEEQEAIDEISHLAQSLQARVSIATDARVEVVAEGTEEWATSDDDPDIVNAMIDLELERIESNSSTTTTSSDDDGSDSDQDEATPTAPTRAEVYNALTVLNRLCESSASLRPTCTLVSRVRSDVDAFFMSKTQKQPTLHSFFGPHTQ